MQGIDSTGAGDAFTGALAVALLEGKPVIDAVEYAVVASEIAIGEYGAQAGYPTREQLEERLHAVSRQRSR